MRSTKARTRPTRRAAAAAAAVAAKVATPTLERRVLDVVAAHPGWDGEQIADELDADLFAVLDVVQALVERGVVGERK